MAFSLPKSRRDPCQRVWQVGRDLQAGKGQTGGSDRDSERALVCASSHRTVHAALAHAALRSVGLSLRLASHRLGFYQEVVPKLGKVDFWSSLAVCLLSPPVRGLRGCVQTRPTVQPTPISRESLLLVYPGIPGLFSQIRFHADMSLRQWRKWAFLSPSWRTAPRPVSWPRSPR